jgi:hypothetical protein
MATTVLSPRSILVHCTLTRSENGAPVQESVWLALQPMLRTPVLCVKPSNGPIEAIFFKTLEMPERDATGRGWHLICKTRAKSEMILLYPTTSQTRDQQLDEVVATIREFRAQALATAEATKAGREGPPTKLDFRHLLALPDEMSRNELPAYFTQSSAQTSVREVSSPLPVSPQSAEERAETCRDENDTAEDPYVVDDAVSCVPFDCVPLWDWRIRWLTLLRDNRARHRPSIEDADTSDSEGDLPRTPIRDFRATRDRKALEHAWAHWIQFVEERRCYSDRLSTDSEWEFDLASDYFNDWFFPDSYFECLSTCDSVPPPCTRNFWQSDYAISVEEADLDGTWELPFLMESDCAGELELIRYTICTSDSQQWLLRMMLPRPSLGNAPYL